jgi:hypothetical protein
MSGPITISCKIRGNKPWYKIFVYRIPVHGECVLVDTPEALLMCVVSKVVHDNSEPRNPSCYLILRPMSRDEAEQHVADLGLSGKVNG